MDKDPQIKELQDIIYFIVFVWFLTAMFAWKQIKYNAEKSEMIVKAGVVINHLRAESSALTKKGYEKDCINIILRNNMCDRDEKYLRQDPVYMELVTKYD